MKLIFVVKCSYGCQETTISNPPESLGGGPPFCARKDLAPRANFRKSQNLVFCFSGQVRHQNKGFFDTRNRLQMVSNPVNLSFSIKA